MATTILQKDFTIRKDALLGSFLILFIASSSLGQTTFDVADFNATGDGKTDDTQAFTKAWEAVCGANGETVTLNIPEGKTFVLQPITFSGPCNSSDIHIQISGNIVAPSTSQSWETCHSESWLYFADLNGLIIEGTGQLDGQGSPWWNIKDQSESPSNGKCAHAAAVRFNNCNNVRLNGTTHINSPRAHIFVDNSTGVCMSNLRITAPEDSPNTDGIDVMMSSEVIISNSFIATGDDCIAIKGNTSNINITNVTCGPGHGISIGSIGENGAHEKVEWVKVQNCTLNSTENGARIKTWPGGSGFVRMVSFEEITLISSGNPIVIDQHYCNGKAHGCPNQESKVEVSNITFNGFQGTSSDVKAINLDCSSIGCNNIIMNQINITSVEPGKDELVAVCSNADGKAVFTIPNVSCLSSSPSEPPSSSPSTSQSEDRNLSPTPSQVGQAPSPVVSQSELGVAPLAQFNSLFFGFIMDIHHVA